MAAGRHSMNRDSNSSCSGSSSSSSSSSDFTAVSDGAEILQGSGTHTSNTQTQFLMPINHDKHTLDTRDEYQGVTSIENTSCPTNPRPGTPLSMAPIRRGQGLPCTALRDSPDPQKCGNEVGDSPDQEAALRQASGSLWTPRGVRLAGPAVWKPRGILRCSACLALMEPGTRILLRPFARPTHRFPTEPARLAGPAF